MTTLNLHTGAGALRAALKADGIAPWDERLALVPTMGYLHEGHQALIRHAAEKCSRVVVSIFVNPLQFAPNEDLDKYPRDLEHDKTACSAVGATDIFFPSVAELTPPDLRVTVDPGDMGAVLCGKSRPTHFRGVCTICTKLFNIVQPSLAVFGWKDAQQQIILRKLVKDLNIPITIDGVEIVREPSGIARSSRNTYLAPDEYRQAAFLSQGLFHARNMAVRGKTAAAKDLVTAVIDTITKNTAGVIDYVECVSVKDLSPLTKIEFGETMIAAAVKFGSTRLIDNVRF